MGSQAVASWIAHVAFWTLLIVGISYGELTRRGASAFVVLWLFGSLGLPRLTLLSGLSGLSGLSVLSGLFATPYVAILDIVLVFIVFKGDIRLT